MHILYVDNDINKYQPLMSLSKINLFEINFRKFDKIYIHIDNINKFYKIYKLFPKKNVIFILEKNILINNSGDIRIIYKNHQYNYNYSFKDLFKNLLKNQHFLLKYIFKESNNG